jgi:hypothetical protein
MGGGGFAAANNQLTPALTSSDQHFMPLACMSQATDLASAEQQREERIHDAAPHFPTLRSCSALSLRTIAS